MARLWSDEARFARWLAVEVAATRAQEAEGLVPAGTGQAIASHARFDPARIDALEATLHHDVIAFLTDVGASLGEEKRFLHLGMTSSDLVDTALALALVEAGRVLLGGIDRLEAALLALAQRHRKTVMVGRTHGVHAEPMTFGLKVLSWATAIRRSRTGLETALRGLRGRQALGRGRPGRAPAARGRGALPRDPRACARAGGDPGGRARSPCAARRRARAPGREPGAHRHRDPPPAAHRGARARGAVRQGTEGQLGDAAQAQPGRVREDRGASARLFRGYEVAALENVALWHERDITHSSVERVILPDAFTLADYMTERLAWVLEGLEVDAARMRANLDLTGGLVYSQRVLLALAAAGLSREDAYAIVQDAAMAAWRGEGGFAELLGANTRASAALGSRLAACFEPGFYLAQVDALYERALRDLGAPVPVR
jgi:adenylosuccinate lyase